jgi:hypothetical protein
MNFLSICSGIEAASIAWNSISWAVPVARWIGERINKVDAWTS